jgi:phosphonate transport system substrate-binding protein
MSKGLKCHPLIKLIKLIILGVIILAGCTDQEQPKKVDLSKRQDINVRSATAALTYAYLPQYSHKVSYQRHHLLVEYLARSTGLTIRQIFPDTFDEHLNMVGRGLIDISFVNPFIYVQLSDRFGSKSLVRVVEPSGQLNFRGQIICRADNTHIQSLEDLKGKRLIAVDPSSAGGYLFPWGLILEQGLRQQDFSEISFAPGPGGKQEKVVLAVNSGKYDVGTIREGTLNLMADKINLKEIKILAQTRYYPGWLYTVRQGLDPAIAERLKKALLALDPHNPEDKKILDAAGFIRAQEASENDFEPIRQLIQTIEKYRVSPKSQWPAPSNDIRTWSD